MDKCSQCEFYKKRHRRSGDCTFHKLAVIDTKRLKVKWLTFTTVEYYCCSEFQQKEQQSEGEAE